ncbi:transporter [Paenibacillus agaridevorans]|uniref:Transporter n=1 Tax=Paenibacillus agaridevorans TaxID=171404 RepID=A0A2R5ET47_9BACL|nr:AEC family transporter [Paenibacillus agaridevorans]GBG09862.1 transporter [Paenibacillus agaridevorans]
MTVFMHVLTNNVLPMGVLIGLGIVLMRAFKLDIKTLSKLNFYLFSPALMFNLLYNQKLEVSLIGKVFLFLLLFMFAQYAIVEIVIRIRGYKASMRSAMKNSVLFYNSANYGIPLNQLAFGGLSHTLAVQIIVMVVQSLIPNTWGIYNVNAHKADMKQVWRTILSMPVIYVIPGALALRWLNVPVPDALQMPVTYLANAFFGTALITLGVQLGSMEWRIKRELAVDVSIAVVLRLAAGPLLAWGIISLWNIVGFMPLDKLTTAALIVSSAVPTSLSSVLLAVEFDNEKEFASQAVFLSTLLSILTITVVIFFLNIQIP